MSPYFKTTSSLINHVIVMIIKKQIHVTKNEKPRRQTKFTIKVINLILREMEGVHFSLIASVNITIVLGLD